jgi:hypothetical protein
VTDHIDHEITACVECEGAGWIYYSEAEHAPGCTGDCGSGCPVEIMGQRACPSCNGSSVEWAPSCTGGAEDAEATKEKP